MNTPRLLMCRPTFFGVSYVINPWMQGQVGQADGGKAIDQWDALRSIFAQQIGISVELIEPQDGLPDMVFTANAGVVHACTFVPSRFKHAERQGEEPHFEAWFRTRGYEISPITGFHEGAGDMLFWTSADGESVLVCAHGFRSDSGSSDRIGTLLGVPSLPLRLADPRFYHLDTCFCPLPGGSAIWYPPAFDQPSQAAIRRLIPEDRRFELPEEDALQFAGNAVGMTVNDVRHVVLGYAGSETRTWLGARGFVVHVTPLTEFLKAGGSAKCLTLRLDGGLV